MGYLQSGFRPYIVLTPDPSSADEKEQAAARLGMPFRKNLPIRDEYTQAEEDIYAAFTEYEDRFVQAQIEKAWFPRKAFS